MKFTLIYRSKVIMTAYKGWITPSSRVLDIGCGNAIVTEELRKHFLCPIVGTDILDYRKTDLPFNIMTNPGKLPFGNNDFDICMFNDALHHSNEQEDLLNEAARVANKVLIFEMEPTITAKIVEVLVNQIHNPNMNIPFNIKTSGQWRSCFERLNFDFEHRKIEKPSVFYPFINFAFNLRKQI
jgi:ubiquinone/menaquinone biosynthesis C-methylase UbiE